MGDLLAAVHIPAFRVAVSRVEARLSTLPTEHNVFPSSVKYSQTRARAEIRVESYSGLSLVRTTFFDGYSTTSVLEACSSENTARRWRSEAYVRDAPVFRNRPGIHNLPVEIENFELMRASRSNRRGPADVQDRGIRRFRRGGPISSRDRPSRWKSSSPRRFQTFKIPSVRRIPRVGGSILAQRTCPSWETTPGSPTERRPGSICTCWFAGPLTGTRSTL